MLIRWPHLLIFYVAVKNVGVGVSTVSVSTVPKRFFSSLPENFLLVAHERKIETGGGNLFFVYPAGEYTLQHHAEEALGGLNNISAVKRYNLETLTIRTQCQQYLNKHPRQQNNGY